MHLFFHDISWNLNILFSIAIFHLWYGNLVKHSAIETPHSIDVVSIFSNNYNKANHNNNTYIVWNRL